MSAQPRSFMKALGPGLLFAGAAVGVSHLVQSTRAGAVYGLALLLVVILANVLKYPAFRFGPQYAAATGTSLLEGYRRQGRWALVLYGLLTLTTMFTVQAAVTLVTAGLAVALMGGGSVLGVCAGLTALCAGLLAVGHYRWLDRIIKVVVVLLTLTTVAAALLVLPRIDWGAARLWPAAEQLTPADIAFVAGLVGWMPSAIDISVWHSLWTLARGEDSGHRASVRESLLDFNIGYLGTVLLAVCFVVLGAGVMHSSGASFEASAGGFAVQVIDLYTKNLGEWSRPLVGVSAFAVMFSTTLTVVDGFPRALAGLAQRLRGPELPSAAQSSGSDPVYWVALAVMAAGALGIISMFIASLKAMVDLATTLSFLTAPLLAWLNHRAITSEEVPAEGRPGPAMIAYSWVGIAALGGFAVYYVYLRFGVG